MRNQLLVIPTRRDGIVLIVVLVLVAMISLAGFAFTNRMATEYKATLMSGDLRQARQTLASAESFLLHVAELQAGHPEPYCELLHDPQLFSSRMLRTADQSAVLPTSHRSSIPEMLRWRFSVVHKLPDRSGVPQQRSDVPDGGPVAPIRFGLQNESGKLHLGRVMLWESQIPGAGRSALLQLPGMTPEAADSILDWIDHDNDPREFGAEQEFYSGLDSPYAPRNGLPQSPEELLFVKGVTRDAYYGAGPTPEFEGPTDLSWPELLTLYSAEPDQSRLGHVRVNLNEIDLSAPTDLSFLPEDLTKFILLARLYGIAFPSEPAGNSGSFAASDGSQAAVSLSEIEIPHHDSLERDQIFSLADLVDSAVQLPAGDGGQLVKSPLHSDSSDFLEIMTQLEEHFTVNGEETIIGRININTAPEPVLRALFGDPAVASQIVRQRQVTEAWERESTAWLLTRRILDLQTYRRIYRDVTTRGAVYSGEVVVYRDFGGPFLRRRLIIDAARQPARRVYWVNLTEHGMPVPTSLLKHHGVSPADQAIQEFPLE